MAERMRARALRARRQVSTRLHRTSWSRRHARVVTSFQAWADLADLAQGLTALLSRHGIEHLVLPDGVDAMPRIAVRREDAAALAEALSTSGHADWWVARIRGDIVGRARWAARFRHVGRADGVMVLRNLVSEGGIQLNDSEFGVAVSLWTTLDTPQQRPGGGVLAAGTLVAPSANGVLDYLDPSQWADAQRADHRLPPSPPHLLVLNEPVDLVYTWVDADDPEWAARKAEALGRPSPTGYSRDAAITARFADRDELRYSLRSVEMFADWARRIWIVTDRQCPDWLVQDDRLKVVDHREVFADPAALPVFNSHAIESQLHHIQGLADRYLYLNDDMLFGAPVRPEQFYHGNGLSKVFLSLAVIDPAPRTDADNAVTAAAKNNRSLMEREFGRTITNKLWHTPQPHSRELMVELEAGHPMLFDTVMRSRFRSPSDHSLTSSLDAYYAAALGRSVTGRVRYGYLNLADPEPWVTMEVWLARRDMHCFCVNDGGLDDPVGRAATAAVLAEFFEAYFPLPSRWERELG